MEDMGHELLPSIIRPIVEWGIREECGHGDHTGQYLADPGQYVTGKVYMKQPGVICGMPVAELYWKTLDPECEIETLARDGEEGKPGKVLMEVTTKAWIMSAGERLALDYLQHLSGIATKTRRFVKLAEPYGVTIAVENLLNRPGDVTRTYAELADVVRRLDSPVVGITLDTGHAQRTEGIDSAFEAFREDLRHLHIHDCVDGVDHHELGRGDLDLARYEEILRARPFLLVLEVGKGAVLALETGQDPRSVVLRSVAAVKRMLGDQAG